MHKRVETRIEMLSMAYSDNVWYHGTKESYVPSILQSGLIPRFQNPHSYSLFQDGVYLSQTPRYAKATGVAVFEVRGIDQNRLLPDPFYVQEVSSNPNSGQENNILNRYLSIVKASNGSGAQALSNFSPQELQVLNSYLDRIGLDTFVYIGSISPNQLRLVSDEVAGIQVSPEDVELGYAPRAVDRPNNLPT